MAKGRSGFPEAVVGAAPRVADLPPEMRQQAREDARQAALEAAREAVQEHDARGASQRAEGPQQLAVVTVMVYNPNGANVEVVTQIAPNLFTLLPTQAQDPAGIVGVDFTSVSVTPALSNQTSPSFGVPE